MLGNRNASRIAPAITLTLAVLAVFAVTLGQAACDSKRSAPPSPDRSSLVPKAIAQVDVGEPEVVAIPPAPAHVARAETLVDREALPRDPGDTLDYAVEGDKHMAAGRALEAVGAYRVALSVDDGAEVWRKLGEAYLAAGDAERGVPCLEEAVAVDVGMLGARRALTKHYLAANEGAKARVHADELVRQRPLDPYARQMLGRAFMQEKMWNEAIDAFTLVVKAQPDNIFAHNNIGYSALQIGSLELAREHLERTLSLEPQHGYMLNNLGVTYERLGRHAEAHAAFSRAAELSPRYAQAKLNRDRLQAGLTHDQRIVSAEALLHMREPVIVDGVVPSSTNITPEVGGDGDGAAAAGGSPRLAPLPIE